MKIVIAFSELKAGHDAIGDYTVLLGSALTQHAQVSIFVEKSDTISFPGVEIRSDWDLRSLRGAIAFAEEVLKVRPDWLLVQYNPFSWGRWGLNPFLPLAVNYIKTRSKHTRIALMVHEPFVRRENFKENPRFAIMTLWQRAQLWKLGRDADRIFFSIEAWTQRFARWFPHATPIHLPVGSNISQVPASRDAIRRQLNIATDEILLLNFGTSHPARLVSPLRPVLAELNVRQVKAKLIAIGTGADAICSKLEGFPVRSLGALPSSEISRIFSAADIYLCPYLDGVSTRRGSFTAAINHGSAIVTTLGPLTDSLLRQNAGRSFLASEVGDIAGYTNRTASLAQDAAERRRLGEAARELFDQHFSWEHIADALVKSLRQESRGK